MQDTVLGFIYIDASAAPQPGDKRPAPTPTKKSPSSRSASRSSLDSAGGSEADLEGQLMAFEEKWTILNEWNDGRMQVWARFSAKKFMVRHMDPDSSLNLSSLNNTYLLNFNMSFNWS